MKKIVTGGLAAACLIVAATSTGAQIHNNPVSHPVYTSSAPRPHPVGVSVAPGHRHGNWRARRYADCLSRYHDRKGCYYLAWHKHWRHASPDLRK